MNYDRERLSIGSQFNDGLSVGKYNIVFFMFTKCETCLVKNKTDIQWFMNGFS